MEIRRATCKDIDLLAQLIERLGSKRDVAVSRLDRIVKDNERAILIYVGASGLLGYLKISKYEYDERAEKFVDLKENACLNLIGVDPNFRLQEIGSKLLCSSDEIAKEWGKAGIWLDCRGKVMPFYISNGYKARGNYFDKTKPRYIMLKRF